MTDIGGGGGGGKGCKCTPLLVANNVFFLCTWLKEYITATCSYILLGSKWHAPTKNRHSYSYTLMFQFLTDLQTFG